MDNSTKNSIIIRMVVRPAWLFLHWLFVEEIIGSLFLFLPIKKNKIVASHFYGSNYGDNPKYIIEKLLQINDGKDLDLVWVINKHKVDKEEDLPDEIRTVEYGTIKHMFELATAKIWIDNSRKMFCPRKKKSQFYMQTWHGSVGLKKVEKDANMPEKYIKNAKRDSEYADVFLSGSKYLSRLYRSAFWYSGEIMEFGSPRLDKMVVGYKDKDHVDALRKKISHIVGLGKDVNTILYAPTFRDDGSVDCYNLDYTRLISAFEKKNGGKWVVLLRLHPNLSREGKASIKNANVVDVTGYPDLYELLPVVDVVISDYSSVGFEAAMIEKPVFVYAPDYDEYIKNERGFYFDLKSLPFPFAETNDALIENIEGYSVKKGRQSGRELMKKLGVNETGKSAEIAARRILSVINGGDSLPKKFHIML